jgi:hypothetical protein
MKNYYYWERSMQGMVGVDTQCADRDLSEKVQDITFKWCTLSCIRRNIWGGKIKIGYTFRSSVLPAGTCWREGRKAKR